MGSFKRWLLKHEVVLGSDGVRDNQPTQTNAATSQVAQQWLGNPQNADDQAKMVQLGRQGRSNLGAALLHAGARAVQHAQPGISKQTTAPVVAQSIQTSLGLPSTLKPPKPPKPTQVKMMRRAMGKQ